MIVTLIADQGYIYTDGCIYSRMVTIPEEQTENFYQISEEEYNNKGFEILS